jgi:hypothetical protein
MVVATIHIRLATQLILDLAQTLAYKTARKNSCAAH